MPKKKEKPAKKVWEKFKKSQNLTSQQLKQFQKYEVLLSEWNKIVNLTSIKNLGEIVRQHFEDSLALKQFMDLKKIKIMADIGTGAGFPAIPLKIIYPHLKLILIEVKKKKQQFLNALIKTLDLKNVKIIDLDWRTFLRTTQEKIDLFVTRAALNELELCRMFKPACFYKNSTLVYWIAKNWTPHPKAEKFLRELKPYKLGRKERKLAFMKLEK